MTHSMIEAIGYFAALCTTAAFIPQAWLTWRTKSASGVSLGMYAVFVTGIALWLAYGVLSGSWPMIAANTITFVLSLFILGMKLRYG